MNNRYLALFLLAVNAYQFCQIINEGIQISYSGDINRFGVNLFLSLWAPFDIL